MNLNMLSSWGGLWYSCQKKTQGGIQYLSGTVQQTKSNSVAVRWTGAITHPAAAFPQYSVPLAIQTDFSLSSWCRTLSFTYPSSPFCHHKCHCECRMTAWGVISGWKLSLHPTNTDTSPLHPQPPHVFSWVVFSSSRKNRIAKTCCRMEMARWEVP